jgi:hypothetical protein
MRSLFTNSSQAGRQHLYKLWANTRAFPHVVFATHGLGINSSLLRSLCEFFTQVFARCFFGINSVYTVFIHTIHRPNKDYYKGD